MMSSSLVIKNFNKQNYYEMNDYFKGIESLSLTDDEIINEFKHFSNHNRVIYCVLLLGYFKYTEKTFIDEEIIHEIIRSKIVKFSRKDIRYGSSYVKIRDFFHDYDWIRGYCDYLEYFIKYIEKHYLETSFSYPDKFTILKTHYNHLDYEIYYKNQWSEDEYYSSENDDILDSYL